VILLDASVLFSKFQAKYKFIIFFKTRYFLALL